MSGRKTWTVAVGGDVPGAMVIGSPEGEAHPDAAALTTVRVEGADAEEVAGVVVSALKGEKSQAEAPTFGEAGRNGRGFGQVRFLDSYGEECLLGASSIIGEYPDSFERPGTSAVWLGLRKVRPQIKAIDAAKYGLTVPQPPTGWVDFPVPEEVLLSGSMHLNREQAAGLIVRLQQWLDTGDFGA